MTRVHADYTGMKTLHVRACVHAGEQLHQRMGLERLTMLAELHAWLETTCMATKDAIHGAMAAAVAGMKGADSIRAAAPGTSGEAASTVTETVLANPSADSAPAICESLQTLDDAAAIAAALVWMDAAEPGA